MDLFITYKIGFSREVELSECGFLPDARFWCPLLGLHGLKLISILMLVLII